MSPPKLDEDPTHNDIRNRKVSVSHCTSEDNLFRRANSKANTGSNRKKKGSLGYPTCNGIGARDKPKSATEPRFVPTEITPSCPFKKKKKLKGRKKQKLKGTHNQCVVQIDFVDGFKAPMAGEQAERKKRKTVVRMSQERRKAT